MKTWILCADDLCAKIFMRKSPEDEACLYRTIRCRKNSQKSNRTKELSHFSHYIAEEMEIACGAGTDSRLVLCAEHAVLKEIKKQLSDQVSKAIIGTIKQNLCNVT